MAEKGIYNKFTVTRNDGKSEPGEKHHNCRYFVLDIDHDPYACLALAAYATGCAETHPELAEDLFMLSKETVTKPFDWKDVKPGMAFTRLHHAGLYYYIGFGGKRYPDCYVFECPQKLNGEERWTLYDGWGMPQNTFTRAPEHDIGVQDE